MRTLVLLAISILRSLLALFRSREEQAIVELALRQQLAVYAHDRSRPRMSPLDRAFWVALVSGLGPGIGVMTMFGLMTILRLERVI